MSYSVIHIESINVKMLLSHVATKIALYARVKNTKHREYTYVSPKFAEKVGDVA